MTILFKDDLKQAREEYLAESKPSQPKPSRQRELNLIYFIDANKTRSVRLSVGKLRYLIAVAGAIAVWGIASIAIVATQQSTLAEMSNTAVELRNTIFEYQTLHDGVFEKAYPTFKFEEPEILAKEQPKAPAVAEKKAIETVAIEKKPAVVTPPAPEVVKEKTTPKEKVVLHFEEDHESEMESQDGIVDNPTTQMNLMPISMITDAETHPVKIFNTRFALDQDKLMVKFDIKNTANPNQQEGYVYGVAKYTDAGTLKESYLGAPIGIALGEDGQPTSPRASYRYSIKYFTSKVLEFVSPTIEGTTSNFTEVKIVVVNKPNRESIYRIVLPTNRTTVAPPPPGPLTKIDDEQQEVR